METMADPALMPDNPDFSTEVIDPSIDNEGLGGGEMKEEMKKKKRNRKPVTCANCRKRKLKCDRNAPCSACRDRGEAHLCSWEDAIRPQAQNMSNRDIEALELRSQLDRLESILGGLVTDSSTDFLVNPALATENPDIRASAEAIKTLAGTIRSNHELPVDPYVLLPKTNQKELLNAFYNKFYPSLPIILAPKFFTKCMNLPVALKRPANPEDWQFIAFILAMCGISKEFGGDLSQSSVVMNGGDDEGFKWIETSFKALVQGKYLEEPNLDGIRALYLLHWYYQFKSVSTSKNMLVNAIQAAYNLNLHRDDGIDHKYNLEEREDRRRLWSMLFAADALFEQGRTYFISSHHADTRTPFHYDDQELQRSPQSWNTSPAFILTSVTRLIVNVELAKRSKTITDRIFSLDANPSYQAVQELNSDLLKLESVLPAALAINWDVGTVKPLDANSSLLHFQPYLVHCDLKRLFIRLHKPFFYRGLTEATFVESRNSCLQYARQILGIQRGLGGDARIIDSLELAFHAVNAAIIVAVDLFQDPDGTQAPMNESDLITALNLLDLIGPRHPALIAAVQVVKTLKSNDFKSIHRNKRRRVDNNPVYGAYGLEKPLPLPLTMEWIYIPGGDNALLRNLFEPLKPWKCLFWAVPDKTQWTALVS